MKVNRVHRATLLCSVFVLAAAFALSLNFVSLAQSTLFSDNFQDGNANGWSRSNGTWAIVTDGTLVFRQSATNTDARIRAGSTSWTNYSVQARVKPLAFGGTGRYVALLARCVNSNHFYYLALQNGNQLVLGKRDGDTSTNLAARSFTVSLNTFYTLRIDAQGSTLSAFVNGALQLTASDSEFTAGAIGGATLFSSGSFDDFLVTTGPVTGNPPPTPTGLTASAGNGSVALTWNASAGATSYNVKRGTTAGGPFATVASVAGTSFVNTGLTNGTQFCYVVSAVNSFGESPNSASVCATPRAGVPPTPTGLNATPGNGQVTLNWNASAGATSYNVKRSLSASGPFATIATVTGTTFTNTGLTNGTTYFFVVSAVNATGESPNSAVVSATPTAGGTPDFRLFGFGVGTTGGRGGSTVSVSTLAALQSAAAASGSMIIQVTGTFTGPAVVEVASNKTIVGTGAGATLTNVELDLGGSSNIIIRNLRIQRVLASNNDGDAIHLQETHNVWIDHCDLSSQGPDVQSDEDLHDGLIDITHDCSFITISWCLFHDHWKTNLIGSSDDDNFDRRVTFHHNFYRNVNSRLPSYRFGTGHVYNSYFLGVRTSGVNSRMGAVLRIEGNVFENANDPIASLSSDEIGFWHVIDNQFINCTGSQPTTSTGTFNPPYTYVRDPSSTVRATVMQWSGVGKTNPLQNLP